VSENRLAQMSVSGRRRLFLVCLSFVILSLLAPSNGKPSSVDNINQSQNKTLEVMEVIVIHLFSRSFDGTPRFLILN
jgi:hypothetical protein